MKRFSLLLMLVVVGRGGLFAADVAPRALGNGLFDSNRVAEVHLTLDREAWRALEPKERGRGPGPGFGPDGGPRPDFGPPRDGGPLVGPGPGGGPGRGPMPMPMERDYPWSRAVVEWDGGRLEDVRIRYKGNSSFNGSRGGYKRPFKLDFNRGHKGRTLLGSEELLLNNNVNDATQVRETLAYEVYRSVGVPAPRTGFARVQLTVTGQFTNRVLGLYTVVEAVNRDFLRDRFGVDRGLLVKPERLQGLEYLGDDWKAYTNRYDPKGSPGPEDTRRFIDLARLVAQADDATFVRQLPERLEVEGFLRFVAVTAVLANYDSFVGNGHNYYLFQPGDARPATFIPWDLNEAFGGHPMAGSRASQTGLSVLRPGGSPNRLLERVLAHPAWAGQYRAMLNHLVTNVCSVERLTNEATRLAGVVRETVMNESPEAAGAFRRIAPGPSPSSAGGGGEPTATGADRDTRRPPGPWVREDLPLADWIQRRITQVTEELAGRREGTTPRTLRPGERPRPGPRPEPRDPIR